MTDLFELMAEKSGGQGNAGYGASGEMKKTQYVLELIGCPADADTLKCVITAAEQGMEMNCYSLITDAVDNLDEYIADLSPLSISPYLKEADFNTCGSGAITAFTDARGLGYALTPRNANLAAMQNYWVDIAETNVAPLVEQIADEVFVKGYSDANYAPDQGVIDSAGESLNVFFDALDQQLQSNKYIVCDKYTWADLHWTAYAHLLEIAGCGALINERSNVKAWFDRIKTRKAQCGQDEVAYEMLPSDEEAKQGKLRSVVIADY
ncbi:MAG: glutathione binding-like protein [Gammaproteobacteria bacterium]